MLFIDVGIVAGSSLANKSTEEKMTKETKHAIKINESFFMRLYKQTGDMMSTQHCTHLEICNGCHYGKTVYQQQIMLKKQTLIDHLSTFKSPINQIPDIILKSSGSQFLRERFDFTIENNQMGLYTKDRKLVDIKECLQLTSDLQKAFDDLKKVQFPIKKGSARLRVSPKGISNLKGIWLDFANLDIKNLLDDGKTFSQLIDLNFEVEIGQKGKSLIKTNAGFKLTEPKPNFWFQTKKFKLLSLISSFTQPSSLTADLITETILEWLPDDVLTMAEFGSGIGQFTLPLLAKGLSVDIYESSELACQFLKSNAEFNKLDQKLTVYNDNFQIKTLSGNKNYDAILINPPRSGLKKFADEIIKLSSTNLIYVSCFPESLVTDLKKLITAGYQIKKITLVDQFPQTKHFETCVLLERINF